MIIDESQCKRAVRFMQVARRWVRWRPVHFIVRLAQLKPVKIRCVTAMTIACYPPNGLRFFTLPPTYWYQLSLRSMPGDSQRFAVTDKRAQRAQAALGQAFVRDAATAETLALPDAFKPLIIMPAGR